MKLSKILTAAAFGMSAMTMSAPAFAVKYVNFGDRSAYVHDNALGATYTNFAFLTATGDFVGSWEVDDGPDWQSIPDAFDGQTAAAFIFGGSASEYTISTISNVFADADHMTWVSVWGVADGTKAAENFLNGSTTAVPELATWAMMIGGFGVVGASQRSRRRKLALAAA